ncbi:hypothetical protein [Flammeovirga aprica]|uniref:Uncharacterized protein n=1 Tax=Flammeovirga aprica JL-4 TaxID=694437 RepID=A0A7X9XAM0_9BACT|nr:hypothetical protein [Flammeovirga aprica]NME69806.1 hypothetical protein [Flammeovirga aprica JL-4]
MYYSRISLLIALIIGAVQLNAQDFTSKKELKKYYKENSANLPSPEQGWHEAWVIMPSESEFETDLEGEVVNASIFMKDGEILKVFYKDYHYAQTVYANGSVKNGKAVYQKVILDINNNVTEVFTAYNHTVIFKKNNNKKTPLVDNEEVGKVSFYSSAKKVEKQGFFVFVRNEKTRTYDFMGYLNKKCSEVKECNEENGLHFYIKSGNYEMLAVQNKIQFNRHMPINTYNVMIEDEGQKMQEIVAKK